MFKYQIEDEIFHSMEKSLVANQTEKNQGFNKLAKVIEYLNSAASIFDNAEMYEESEDINNVLKSIANLNK